MLTVQHTPALTALPAGIVIIAQQLHCDVLCSHLFARALFACDDIRVNKAPAFAMALTGRSIHSFEYSFISELLEALDVRYEHSGAAY